MQQSKTLYKTLYKISSKTMAAGLLVGLTMAIVVPRFLYSRSEPKPQDKLSLSILKNLDEGKKSISALVYLRNQASLDKAAQFPIRADRARYVYDSLREVALVDQLDLVSFLQTKKDVRFRRFYIANMIAIENATPELIQELSERADVGKIRGNPSIQNILPQTDPAFRDDKEQNQPQGIGENIESTGASRVWSEYNVRGDNIVVAGQDTGVQWDHPALKNHYRGFSAEGVTHDYFWHDSIHSKINPNKGANPCGYNAKAPCDDDQHGSHTMGTVVGDDGQGNQIGMAPGAKWIACRNMDQGLGTPATYIECFEFFLAPYAFGGDPMIDGDPSKAPDVMNNSWGCPKNEGCEGDEFFEVLTALKASGVMVIASAGNAGSSCSTINDQPASHSELTFSVGAHNHKNGAIASFSSRGPSLLDGGLGPDVTAPGVNVRSSVPGNNYAEFGWSGTSMAGPHAVGLIALLWSAHPELVGNIDETARIVRESATPKNTTQNCGGVPGSAHPNNTYGYGSIDAYKAVSSYPR